MFLYSRRLLTVLGLAFATGTVFAGPVSAEETAGPLQLRVRPSGRETASSEALERQQRLLKKLEQADFSIRSICIQCGDGWKHQIYAPFDPHTTLRSRPPEDGMID